MFSSLNLLYVFGTHSCRRSSRTAPHKIWWGRLSKAWCNSRSHGGPSRSVGDRTSIPRPTGCRRSSTLGWSSTRRTSVGRRGSRSTIVRHRPSTFGRERKRFGSSACRLTKNDKRKSGIRRREDHGPSQSISPHAVTGWGSLTLEARIEQRTNELRKFRGTISIENQVIDQSTHSAYFRVFRQEVYNTPKTETSHSIPMDGLISLPHPPFGHQSSIITWHQHTS